jgi:hypothetical protein
VIEKGQRVRVYYNLHKQCLSVMDKKTRLVVTHTDYISLDNVKFIVSAAGLARLRRRKRKSVIAFVEGNYTFGRGEKVIDNPEWGSVYFNPYKVEQFMMGGKPIYKADHVYIVDKNIYTKKEIECATC